MQSVIFFDGDGGGWGGQLRSLVHAIAFAELHRVKVISFYPLIGRVFRLSHPLVVTADALDRQEILLVKQAIIESNYNEIGDTIEDSFGSARYVLAGKHHIPSVIAEQFHKHNRYRESLPVFSKRVLSSMYAVDQDLISLAKEKYCDIGLDRDYGAIQVRSFFDSQSGNREFRRNYSAWVGWLIETLEELSMERADYIPERWILVSDSPRLNLQLTAVLGSHFKNLIFDCISSESPVHTSIAFRLGQSTVDQPGKILDQYWVDRFLIQSMYEDLADWFILSNASTIISTGTSYAGTASSCIRDSREIHYYVCGDDLDRSPIYGPY